KRLLSIIKVPTCDFIPGIQELGGRHYSVMNGPILVSGASGVLGRAIVSAFSDAGGSGRQGCGRPEKARAGVESVHLDYTEPETFASAMNGASSLLLMAPPLDGY